MSQLQSPFTQQQYFSNNHQGYDKPHTISLPEYNIEIKCYFNQLKPGKLEKINRSTREVFKGFFEAFPSAKRASQKLETINIFIFNDKEDYQHLGGKVFKLGLGSEGGKAYYRGLPTTHTDLYMYQQGETRNLQHELAHALTFYATQDKHNNIPTVLLEGIADFFEHQLNLIQLTREECVELTYEKLAALSYSEDSKLNQLLYRTGHAIVGYLQAKHPGLLDQYFSALHHGESQRALTLLQSALNQPGKLETWLYQHSLEKRLIDSNSLKVQPKDYLVTTREIVSGEIKNVNYYRSTITSQTGETVGHFSPVVHLWQGNELRAINRATNDYLGIPADYHFLKVTKRSAGKVQVDYCDSQGNRYADSQAYQKEIINKISSKFPELSQWLAEQRDLYQRRVYSAQAEYQHSYDKLTQAIASGISREDYQKLIKINNSDYQKYLILITNTPHQEEKIKLMLYKILSKASLNKESQEFLQKEKLDSIHTAIQSVLQEFKELTSITSPQLASIEPQQIKQWSESDKILAIRVLGHGDVSALSIFSDSKKVGELSTEAGFFRSVAPVGAKTGTEEMEFIYEDSARGLYCQYQNPTLAVTRQAEKYQLHFVETPSFTGDRYLATPHFRQNELLQPGIQHLDSVKEKADLLFQGVISRQADSPHAAYTHEQWQQGVIVTKDTLLDDKGTANPDDDTYAAVVEQQGQLLHRFTHTGFYISENGDFFIHDHGRNRRWQLPNSMTHLKLIKDENSKIKLIPCDEHGNENPEGMPDIPDAYRFIDPVFAHRYQTKGYSESFVNIGLINFNRYAPGTLFSIEYDPKDPAIPRDAEDNILRPYDGASYFTKVKVKHNGQDIGILSNDFHQFQGKIFFSVDYNYSYSDFLASVSPQVVIDKQPDGGQRISFERGNGDLAGTDRGYTDYKSINTPSSTQQLTTNMAAVPDKTPVGSSRQPNGAPSFQYDEVTGSLLLPWPEKRRQASRLSEAIASLESPSTPPLTVSRQTDRPTVDVIHSDRLTIERSIG